MPCSVPPGTNTDEPAPGVVPGLERHGVLVDDERLVRVGAGSLDAVPLHDVPLDDVPLDAVPLDAVLFRVLVHEVSLRAGRPGLRG
jgi:hypothetical protein